MKLRPGKNSIHKNGMDQQRERERIRQMDKQTKKRECNKYVTALLNGEKVRERFEEKFVHLKRLN
jgi:hypothetical protein